MSAGTLDRRESRETHEALAAGANALAVLRDSRRRIRMGSMKAAQRLDKVIADVEELLQAAWNASATLGHAYHTVLDGKLADAAHDDYQRLDAALTRFGDAQ